MLLSIMTYTLPKIRYVSRTSRLANKYALTVSAQHNMFVSAIKDIVYLKPFVVGMYAYFSAKPFVKSVNIKNTNNECTKQSNVLVGYIIAANPFANRNAKTVSVLSPTCARVNQVIIIHNISRMSAILCATRGARQMKSARQSKSAFARTTTAGFIRILALFPNANRFAVIIAPTVRA